MLTNPSAGRRTAGRLTIVAAVAVALPLTATRAIEYVDKVVPAAPVITAAAPAATAVPAAPAIPSPPAEVHRIDVVQARDGQVTINGKTKRWSELTPAEKSGIRQKIAEARREIAEHRADGGKIGREIQEAMAESKIDKEELLRELADARAEIARAMAEVDARGADMRRVGVNPDQIKASIRASLKEVEKIDVEAIRRDALASIDVAQIEASVEQGLRAAEAELDRIEALDRED